MFTIFLGIILAIVVFMVIVGLHEWGHFVAARRFGVRVFEFGLGIPPKMMTYFRDKKGTDYTLNWLPLGGFVRLKGEAFDERVRNDSDALFNKPIWQQMIIVLAGIVMNFLTAWALFALVFFLGVKPVMFHFQDNPVGILSNISFESLLIPTYASLDDAVEQGAIVQNQGVVLSPIEGSVAQQAGIQPSDIVTKINDEPISRVEDFISYVQTGDPLAFTIMRDDTQTQLAVTPEDGKIGAYVVPNLTVNELKYNLITSIQKGFVETKNQIVLTAKLLAYMVHVLTTSDDADQKKEVVDGIGGPIAVGNVFVSMAQQGISFMSVLIFGALISISLGVFNLLPIPALDGGRFLVLFINGCARLFFKKDLVDGKLEGYIHAFGFLLMILLALFIAYKDVLRIIG